MSLRDVGHGCFSEHVRDTLVVQYHPLSFSFLRAALAASACFSLSDFFRSTTSKTLCMPSRSNFLLRWQNSYMAVEPKQKLPTAQVHAVKIGTIPVRLHRQYDRVLHTAHDRPYTAHGETGPDAW